METIEGGGDATSGPGPGPYLAPPLFVAPQHCASLHLLSLSLSLSPPLSLSVPLSASLSSLHALDVASSLSASLPSSASPARPAACRLDDSVITGRRREEGDERRVPLSFVVASFRDVSIDFISRGCITGMRSSFKARS